jgi:SPP1 gp7 family putative phage head morphogenesis protein
MTALDNAIRALRAASLRTERQAQRAILAAWAVSWSRLLPYVSAAVAQALATQADTPASASFAIAALPTVRALQAALARELPLFASLAATATVSGQRAAVATAPALAAGVVTAALGTPPAGAAAISLVTPSLFTPSASAAQIAATIARLAPGMGDAGAQAIAAGVLAGKGPRHIARDVRLAANVAPVRALVISRTSINEGFRRTALATYQANRDIVTGWRWLCSRGPRTCGLCFAMDGRVFSVDTPFASHPACRCVPVPITRDLPGYSSPPLPEPGREAFAALSAADQRHILGAGKHAMYLAGDLDWDALVTETFSRTYGPGRRETPLRALRRSA